MVIDCVEGSAEFASLLGEKLNLTVRCGVTDPTISM
jgi:hypothetical protein